MTAVARPTVRKRRRYAATSAIDTITGNRLEVRLSRDRRTLLVRPGRGFHWLPAPLTDVWLLALRKFGAARKAAQRAAEKAQRKAGRFPPA